MSLTKIFLFFAVSGLLVNMFAQGPSSPAPSVVHPEVQEVQAEKARSKKREDAASVDAYNAKTLTELPAKIAELRALPLGTKPWDLLAASLRDALSSIPPSPERSAVLKPYKELVRPHVEQIARLTSKVFMETATEMWASAMDSKLLEMGSNIEVTSKKTKVGYRADVKYGLMSRALAYKLANDGGMLESATAAGIDRISFKNSISGESWTYDLEGSKIALAKATLEANKYWLLNQD